MNRFIHIIANCLPLALLIAAVTIPCSLTAGDEDASADKANTAFTLDEALRELKFSPRDAYLQYVTLQLARRENRVETIASKLDDLQGIAAWDRSDQVDLFSLFSGAVAVQESLQLDTMRGDGRRSRPGTRRGPRQLRFSDPSDSDTEAAEAAAEAAAKALARRRQEIVDLASLAGPTIKSHPWEEMLAGRKPDVGRLASMVPEDFFFAEFGSLSNLLDVVDSGELWTRHLLHQAAGEARRQQVGDRLKRQLVVETNRLVLPVYDRAVEEVAITGSDLFFNEGSDLTLLVRLKQPAVFKSCMDGFLHAAEQADTTVHRTTGKYNGIEYVHAYNASRSVHVFSAYPEANLHVRSNSLPALKRVLAAIQGKDADGQPVRRLGDSSEFAYIRTLMPRGAKEEDGFMYLSDPFIRKLVGPSLKLTERRRMLCYNHLRMIGHASLMYCGEFGRPPDSLETLATSQCSPGLFGTGELNCPDGGKYSLSADGTAGVCSHHGHSHDLVPCIAHPVAKVTGEEADEYKAFLAEYDEYWRTYFDPIAIRIKVSEEQYRLETIILPLIDNSIYTGLQMILGGPPEPLDALPVPSRNIFSINFRLNKERLVKESGLETTVSGATDDRLTSHARSLEKSVKNLKQIGLAIDSYFDKGVNLQNQLPPQALRGSKGEPLLSWRVMLLPFLDQKQLYKEFHLDEPWDSEHNKTLIGRMPAVFRSPSAKGKPDGRTPYLAAVGENLMFTGDPKGLRYSDATDGLSDTILIVQSDEEHAVPWTKPEDLTIDLKKPASGLDGTSEKGSPALFADGSVGIIPRETSVQDLAGLFTRNGKEQVATPAKDAAALERRGYFEGDDEFLEKALDELDWRRFLLKGIGNQAGLHLYDAPAVLDVNVSGALGSALSSSNRDLEFIAEAMVSGVLTLALSSPVYVSVSVQDAAIVDDFLNRLDGVITGFTRQALGVGWSSFHADFYHMSTEKGSTIRCLSGGFGPLKVRVFWVRIGNTLYIASKAFVLDDLASAAKAQATVQSTASTGHAMFRIRSKNWNQVLADYRLGWAENNRIACLDNLGRLGNVARSLPGSATMDEVCRCAERLHGAHLFCPEEGRYERAPDGKLMICSLHGSVRSPRQAAAPVKMQAPGNWMSGFAGLEATLTFLEDGLRAVVTIDRKLRLN